MNNKKWYLSKLLWLGILEIIGGVAAYIGGVPAGTSIAAMIAGAVTVILRIITNKGLIA